MTRRKRRRLGQHFLTDTGCADRIVGLLAEQPSRVLEIGPGRGALTSPLVERFERVLAFEVDADLAAALRGRFDASRLEVVETDALREPLELRLEGEAPWQVVGNLPYSVGSAILRRMLPRHDLFSRIVVMLQKEVVGRLVARPGDRNHGLMALERAAWADARVAFDVGQRAFRPRPRVMSSVVVLEPRPPVDQPEALERAFALASRALTRPRKKLRNALDVADGELAAGGVDPDARPGTLTLVEWVQLARHLGDR
jgi:16S rRNA (adenine1518-N6/adenine1519-N6)-dimethyltransferase